MTTTSPLHLSIVSGEGSDYLNLLLLHISMTGFLGLGDQLFSSLCIGSCRPLLCAFRNDSVLMQGQAGLAACGTILLWLRGWLTCRDGHQLASGAIKVQ